MCVGGVTNNIPCIEAVPSSVFVGLPVTKSGYSLVRSKSIIPLTRVEIQRARVTHTTGDGEHL